jgi:hypothetical protein
MKLHTLKQTKNIITKCIIFSVIAFGFMFMNSCATHNHYSNDSFGYTNSPAVVKKTVRTTTTTTTTTRIDNNEQQNNTSDNWTEESYENGIFSKDIFETEQTTQTETETIINNYYYVDPYYNSYYPTYRSGFYVNVGWYDPWYDP